MTNDKILLEKLQSLLDLQKEKEKQKTKRGENFNIFTVMNMTSNETKLHSAFIAELLNPCGSHGLGIKPLKSFLLLIDEKCFSDDELQKATIVTEYNIGSIPEDYTSGGNIDILIKVGGKYIVIENKIYAVDQPKQMWRYHNFCKSYSHKLLYLTLDRHLPCDDSVNGLQVDTDFQCISYSLEIKCWLIDCLRYASTFPLVRETLQQYLQTVLNLTNQEMDKEDKENFLKLMADYPEVVAKISNNLWYYRQYIVSEYFVKPFKQWCNVNEFRWYEDANFINQAKGQGFGIYHPQWKKMIAVEFDSSDFRNPSYGVWNWESQDKTKGLLLGNKNNESWPYGWEYFDTYKYWDESIAEDMKEGRVFQYVLDKFKVLIDKIISNPNEFPMN